MYFFGYWVCVFFRPNFYFSAVPKKDIFYLMYLAMYNVGLGMLIAESKYVGSPLFFGKAYKPL